MRDGFRAFDADTHVNPAADVLDRYVDPSFRPRLAELAPYRVASGQMIGGTPGTDQYRVATKLYRRVLGQAGPHEIVHRPGHPLDGDAGSRRVGVQDDQAENRVKDMDDEGTDAHFLVPTSWVSVVGLPDVELEVGLIRAYHRHAADFCGQFPARLKTAIVASTRAVDEAVREIHRWGTSKWAVAVLPVLGKDMPLDHPDLEPIWQAAQEHDLAVVHHSNTWNPPYFPAYQDLWDNIFLGRLASHPWGGMRFMAAFIGAGIMDRYPRLRMGILECGFGWLPFWARRMDEQAAYVGGVAPLKHAPSEYLTSGRFFCTIERHEGEDLFNFVTERAGRRRPDVRLGLPALGVPVPRFRGQHPALVEPQAGHAAEAPLGQRGPVLQTDLRAERAMPQISGLGHVGLYCHDLGKMRDFYAGVLGLAITDEDLERGICFLSAQPDAEHHELALAQAREPAQKTHNVQQVSFKVKSLDDVRAFYHRLQDAGMRIERTITHGIACSVYFFDPEDNRIELYYTTPYKVRQPLGEKIDLDRPDAELLAFAQSFEETRGRRAAPSRRWDSRPGGSSSVVWCRTWIATSRRRTSRTRATPPRSPRFERAESKATGSGTSSPSSPDSVARGPRSGTRSPTSRRPARTSSIPSCGHGCWRSRRPSRSTHGKDIVSTTSWARRSTRRSWSPR